jgi:flagellar secretion chaperone FliS
MNTPSSRQVTLNSEAYQSYHSVNLGARASQASSVQLVLMLTDGLLEELSRARAHIVARRYELKARSLNRCIDILNGLASALDYETGGDLVTNLNRLYNYCVRRLYKSGFDLDPALIDEVIGLTINLRKGWQGYQDRHG